MLADNTTLSDSYDYIHCSEMLASYLVLHMPGCMTTLQLHYTQRFLPARQDN